MRKSILVFVAVAFATFSFAQKEKKEKNETIEGNGKTVTRDVTVSSFDILKAKGVYELKIAQGDKESVKIEADENLQQYFEVKNEGSQLTINMNLDGKSLKTEKSLKVYVTFKKLKEMDLKMVGNVNSE